MESPADIGVPHPEWVGWSNDKHECFDDVKPKEEVPPVVPAVVPVKKEGNKMKYVSIALVVILVLLFAFFLHQKYPGLYKSLFGIRHV